MWEAGTVLFCNLTCFLGVDGTDQAFEGTETET